jgi:hypothetical protein
MYDMGIQVLTSVSNRTTEAREMERGRLYTRARGMNASKKHERMLRKTCEDRLLAKLLERAYKTGKGYTVSTNSSVRSLCCNSNSDLMRHW